MKKCQRLMCSEQKDVKIEPIFANRMLIIWLHESAGEPGGTDSLYPKINPEKGPVKNHRPKEGIFPKVFLRYEGWWLCWRFSCMYWIFFLFSGACPQFTRTRLIVTFSATQEGKENGVFAIPQTLRKGEYLFVEYIMAYQTPLPRTELSQAQIPNLEQN